MFLLNKQAITPNSTVDCHCFLYLQLIHHSSVQEIVGHNEDNDAGMKAHSYIVSAEILSENGTTVEQFTAFAYPGFLPGNAFSFNRAGVIFTLNSESPITVPTDKIRKITLCLHLFLSYLTCVSVARYVMNRALMAAENPEDVERIIGMQPGLSQGCRYEYSTDLSPK